MTALRATVRLQFNGDFTLDDALRVLPYLADLGISHIYASPIMAARPGSTHGYDVIDPNEINPEIGGYPALLRLSDGLRRQDMGLIIDIVPNHMAVSIWNPWWRDVLEHGRNSRFAEYFDIDWEDPDPEIRGKILLPCLGDSLDACLARGELQLDTDAQTHSIVCHYFDQSFPITVPSGGNIECGDHDAREDSGRGKLRKLLDAQHYRLTYWREAASRINWRRFFDINQLVALRMERDEVFAAYHRRVLDLYRDGIIDGVRVDHVDGLADPTGYCRKLRVALDEAGRNRSGISDPYIVLEKILEGSESLNRDWPVDGSTGYDFMNQAAALLHAGGGANGLSEIWQRHTGETRDFAEMARDARREIVQRLFPKQLDRVLSLLRLGGDSPPVDDQQRHALVGLLAGMRRYRLYGDTRGFSEADGQILDEARARAREDLPAPLHPVLDEVCHGLRNISDARVAFQQLSATLTAKAVEDTAFYRYSRLLSRNEVGGDPGQLAIEPAAFHDLCAKRHRDFPRSMLATATHDHKRGEDNRLRLAILSEIPQEWGTFAGFWLARHSNPAPAIQLMVYQSIIGAWPLSLRHGDRDALSRFHERMAAWLQKALREAKQETSWDNPNAAFEAACAGFLAKILNPSISGEFLTAIEAFVGRIAPAGIVNSLSQTLLRLTTPGIPDLYQGTEFWDFSLVDPDNRGAVDFAAHAEALAAPAPIETLMNNWRDGRIKQALIARVLRFRKRREQLFATGDYAPVPVSGPSSAHLVALLRRQGDEAALVLASRHCAEFLGGGDPPLVPPDRWRDTVLHLPVEWTGASIHDVLNDRALEKTADIASLLGPLPVALFHLRTSTVDS